MTDDLDQSSTPSWHRLLTPAKIRCSVAVGILVMTAVFIFGDLGLLIAPFLGVVLSAIASADLTSGRFRAGFLGCAIATASGLIFGGVCFPFVEHGYTSPIAVALFFPMWWSTLALPGLIGVLWACDRSNVSAPVLPIA